MVASVGFAGEPGTMEDRISHAFGSAPIEQPESTSVQTPGARTVIVEVPAPEKPGLLSWLGEGVQAVLGFAGEWVVTKPVNVTTEALVATRNVGTNILDGAGNMATRATE